MRKSRGGFLVQIRALLNFSILSLETSSQNPYLLLLAAEIFSTPQPDSKDRGEFVRNVMSPKRVSINAALLESVGQPANQRDRELIVYRIWLRSCCRYRGKK